MNRTTSPSLVSLAPLVALVALAASCGPSAAVMTGLPIASVSCPASGRVGVPFTIDASRSADDEGAFLLVELDVNGDKRTELTEQSFTVDYDGIVVAALKVTDKSQNVASATCRFLVERDANDVDAPAPGADPQPSPDAEPQPSPDTEPTPDDGVVPDTESDSLTGSFAMIAYDMPRLDGGGLDPATQCMPAPSIARVDLVEGAGELTMSLTWCHIEAPDVQLGFLGVQDSEIPDSTTALLGTLGPATFPFDGVSFSPPLDVFGRALLAGATNSDGPLPDNNDAPNVNDPDGDDNQGVPMFTGPFLQLNVAMRRTITALSGDVVSNDEIDGSDDGSFEVRTEIGLLDSGATSFAQPASSTSLPSRFKMTRVVDNASCSAIVAQQASLIAALSAPEAPDACYEPQQQ